MGRKVDSFRPASLAQHFEAPEDYVGHFGWVCGYSADASFLNDAAERFTRLTHSQRAHQGHVSLAVFLDPGNPAISMLDSPGVAHLPIINHREKPFQLLHAKVALLGFRHQVERNQWRLRLIVSTGNWTRQTLEESLDLVWGINVTSESLIQPEATTRQDCADIGAAWKLLAWIQQIFDTRLLGASINGHDSETMSALKQVSEWVDMCSGKAKGEPRFFDSRNKSLLSQLPAKIKVCGDVKRNYLAMGSGFYEAATDQKKPPEVLTAILESLRSENLLTSKPEVDIYVNAMACQAIATAVKPLQKDGMTIRPAAIPPVVFGQEAQRRLHAKFLFSANYREDSNVCASAWVYLGSGNLTKPGFNNGMGAGVANLEAGVVFAPPLLYWEMTKSTETHHVVTNLLPIQWHDAIDETTLLTAGSDMELRDSTFVSPPVAWLTWFETDGACELHTDDPGITDVQVLNAAGAVCPKTPKGVQWSEAKPRQVRIRWLESGEPIEATIAVIDEYGRIAATELPNIDTDEAWWQLADFPMPPDEDGADEANNGDSENGGASQKNVRLTITTSYPIRQMMGLIESIAAKQTEIDELDWPLWCKRLESTLGQATESAQVTYFRNELRLNPLSPLWHAAFRPPFAEANDLAHGKLYEETLCRIEKRWSVDTLPKLGAEQ